jgi:Mg/Co/Ni transporter MgtE
MNKNLKDILEQYSTQNIERLWNSFSTRTRKRIARDLSKNNIDANKLFSEHNTDAQNEIVIKFKHAGANTFIGWERDWK